MKRSLSILLIIIFLFGSIPVYANTQSTDIIIVSLLDTYRNDLIIMLKESTFKKSNESLSSKLAKIQDLNLREGSDDYYVFQRNKERSTLTKKITEIYPSYFLTLADTTKSKSFSSIPNQEFGIQSKDLFLQNGIIMNTNDGNKMPVSYLFDYNYNRNQNLNNEVTQFERKDADRVVTEMNDSWRRVKAFVLASTNKRTLTKDDFSKLLYGLATKTTFTIDDVKFTFELDKVEVTLKNNLSGLSTISRSDSIKYIDRISKRTLSEKRNIDENEYISLSMLTAFALVNEKGLGINSSTFESLDLGLMEKTINKMVGSINALTNTLLSIDTNLEGELTKSKDGIINLYFQYITVPIIVISIIVALIATIKGKLKDFKANSDVRTYLYSTYEGVLTAIIVFALSAIIFNFLYSLNSVLVMVVGLNGMNTIDVNSMSLLLSLLFLIIAIPIALIKSIIQVYTLLLPLFTVILLFKYLFNVSSGNNNFEDELKQIFGFAIASSVFFLMHSIAVAFINLLVLNGHIGAILTPIIYLTVVLFIFHTVNITFNRVFDPIISFLKAFGINLEVIGSVASSAGRAIQGNANKGSSSSNVADTAPVSYSAPEASLDLNAKSNAFNGANSNSFKPETTTSTDSMGVENRFSSNIPMSERLKKVMNNPQAKIAASNTGKFLESAGTALRGAGKMTEGTANLLQNGNGLASISQGMKDFAIGGSAAAKTVIDTPVDMFKQHKYDKFLENGATKGFSESGNGGSYELDNGYFNKHGIDIGFDKGYTANWDNDKISGSLRDNANYINHYDKTQGTDALMSNFGFSDLKRDSSGRINGFTLKANSDEKDLKGKSLYNNNMERVLGISSIKRDDINNTTTISKQGIYKKSNYEPIPDLKKVQRFDNTLDSILNNSDFNKSNKTGLSFNTEKVREIAKEKNIDLNSLYEEFNNQAI